MVRINLIVLLSSTPLGLRSHIIHVTITPDLIGGYSMFNPFRVAGSLGDHHALGLTVYYKD